MMSPIGTKTAPKMLERPSHRASCLQMRTARAAWPSLRRDAVASELESRMVLHVLKALPRVVRPYYRFAVDYRGVSPYFTSVSSSARRSARVPESVTEIFEMMAGGCYEAQ